MRSSVKSAGPRYRVLENTIVSQIADGVLAPGALLDSPEDLAGQFDASPSTIRLAFQSLASQGILVRTPRRGTTVSPDAPQLIRGSRARRSAEKANQLFFLVPDMRFAEHATLAEAFLSVAEDFGVEVIVNSTGDDIERYDLYVHRCVEQQCMGLIIAPPMRSPLRPRTLAAIDDAKLPVVTCWRPIDTMGWPVVRADPMHASYSLTRHLTDNGCRAIATLTFDVPMHDFNKLASLHGYLRALSEAGLRSPDDWHAAYPTIATTDDLIGSEKTPAFAALVRWIAAHPEVDGVMCQHDILAVLLAKAMAIAGRSVPQDVRLGGNGNLLPYTAMMHPSLTTYGIDFKEFARRAVGLIVEARAGRNVPTSGHHEVIPGRLVIGDSTALPKTAKAVSTLAR